MSAGGSPGRILTPVRAALSCLRSEGFPPSADPCSAPLARLLTESGLSVQPVPVWPVISQIRWLQGCVRIGGLEIVYRHPCPDLVLVSSIRRHAGSPGFLRPVMDGLLRYFLHCAHPDAGINAILATIDPDDGSGSYPEEHARRFFEKTVGWMEKVPMRGRIWYVGDPRDVRRDYGGRLWRRIAATPAELASLP